MTRTVEHDGAIELLVPRSHFEYVEPPVPQVQRRSPGNPARGRGVQHLDANACVYWRVDVGHGGARRRSVSPHAASGNRGGDEYHGQRGDIEPSQRMAFHSATVSGNNAPPWL